MCTVSYLPLSSGYILTHSRDESPNRKPATFPHYISGQACVYPKDMEAGGTWIGLRNDGTTMCVLNGAFAPHTRRPPYKLSRGLVLLAALEAGDAHAFSASYDFDGIEPFTLIAVEASGGKVYRWDSEQVHVASFDLGGPAIWSSTPLYDPAARIKREEWFHTWYHTHWEGAAMSQNVSPSQIVQAARTFHYDEGTRPAYEAIMMERPGRIHTVSVTTVISTADRADMYYQPRGSAYPAMAPALAGNAKKPENK